MTNSKGNYKHLQDWERDRIELLLKKGCSVKSISEDLGRSKTTIYREIERNQAGYFYSSDAAHKRAEKRWKETHQKIRLKNDFIREYVIEKLICRWSPEQIAGRLSVDFPEYKINYESIYLFIYMEMRELYKYLARSHRKRLKRTPKKNKKMRIPDLVRVDKRPDIRGEYGHWESDLVEGHAGALCVLGEKFTKMVRIVKLPDKSAISNKNAIMSSLRNIESKFHKTITYDNGLENVLHNDINEEFGMNSYFCYPYHSWEKGFIENTNGLVRRYLPKRTDFNKISGDQIKWIEDQLNNRPRKSLGFKTPNQVYCMIAGVALSH